MFSVYSSTMAAAIPTCFFLLLFFIFITEVQACNKNILEDRYKNEHVPLPFDHGDGNFYTFNVSDVKFAFYAPHATYIVSQKDYVYVCGYGQRNQFGLGEFGASLCPIEIIELRNQSIIKFCSGDFYTLAMTNDGLVWGWGRNLADVAGVLGTDDDLDHFKPIRLPRFAFVTDIECGSRSSFAITKEGYVYVMGAWYDHNGNYVIQKKPTRITIDSSGFELGCVISFKVSFSHNAFYGLAIHFSGEVTKIGYGIPFVKQVKLESTRVYNERNEIEYYNLMDRYWSFYDIGYFDFNKTTQAPYAVQLASTINCVFILDNRGRLYITQVNQSPNEVVTRKMRFKAIYGGKFDTFLILRSTYDVFYVWKGRTVMQHDGPYIVGDFNRSRIVDEINLISRTSLDVFVPILVKPHKSKNKNDCLLGYEILFSDCH